jgi:glycosyltransferase 2 family protein
MKKYITGVLLSLLVTVALYGAAVVVGGSSETLDKLTELSVVTWLIVIALSLGNYVLRFVRWHFYIARLSACSVPLWEHWLIYLAGFALTTTPGKAGEVLRSLYLSRDGVSYTDSISAWFVERVVDLITILLLALLAVSYFNNEDANTTAMVVGIIVICSLPLLHSPLPAWFLDRSARGIPRISGIASRFKALLAQSALLLRSRFLISGLLIGLVAWFLEGFGFYLVLRELSIESGMLLAVGIYGLGVLIGALSFIPGGLGSTEASMMIFLHAIGADTASAVAATLVCRIVTLWLAVFLGILAALLLGSTGRVPQFSTGNEQR